MKTNTTRRFLVIPDIHNQVEAAEIILTSLRKYYDRAILLGDYFDAWGEAPGDEVKTARWLAKSLRKRERIHLLGNHDLPYIFPNNPHLSCPGFSGVKLSAVAPFLKKAPLERLRLAYSAHGWLFSHAGVGAHLWNGEPPEILANHVNSLLPKLAEDKFEPWVACGIERGGSAQAGGVTWLDWRWEFSAITGLNQIVGHTVDDHVRSKNRDNYGRIVTRSVHCATLSRSIHAVEGIVSMNWCLDSRLQHVALIDPEFIVIFNPGRTDDLDRLVTSFHCS